MAFHIIASNLVGSGIQVQMGNGDFTDVAQGILVASIDGGTAIGGLGNASQYWGSVILAGQVIGGIGVRLGGVSSANLNSINITATGQINAFGNGVELLSSAYSAINSGDIESIGNGIVAAGAGGVIYNYGKINASVAININDATNGNRNEFVNYGEITGSSYGFKFAAGASGAVASSILIYNYGTISGGGAYLVQQGLGVPSSEVIYNAGTIDGSVTLGNDAGAYFDSTLGACAQTIYCGTGGDVVVAGNTGGSVVGGAGNDILYANQTANIASNLAQTILDGQGGHNVMYGNNSRTTFISGDTNGGTNQIWGGLGAVGIEAYQNNTLSYEFDNGHGVYVDLLNGHNAYVSSTANWTGTGRFEDYISTIDGNSSVGSIIGSSGGDIIICDNYFDRICGAGGADQLYAGASGADVFVYRTYADSNVISGYDTIVGFKSGTDTIDISQIMATGLSPASLQISTNGTSNTVYVERTPGLFNSATDLALIVNTSLPGGLQAGDFVF